jgi:hypothetical protein
LAASDGRTGIVFYCIDGSDIENAGSAALDAAGIGQGAGDAVKIGDSKIRC